MIFIDHTISEPKIYIIYDTQLIIWIDPSFIWHDLTILDLTYWTINSILLIFKSYSNQFQKLYHLSINTKIFEIS